MMNKQVTAKDLIHKNEGRYFILAIIASILVIISLITSILGIFIALFFIVLSLFSHALMLGYFRTNAVRLNPQQFPQVYEKVKELCMKMEIPSLPDVYVMESSGMLNAFASRFFGRNMVLLYSSIFELIEQGNEAELSFVIAHELAHIKRNHVSKFLLIFPAMWVPGIGQAYSRACEYTCDRFAAYYTENPEAAKNSLTILAIGKSLYKHVNQKDYLKQLNEEKGFFVWLSEKLSTHPPLPKRIEEIATFLEGAESIIEKKENHRTWIWVPASLLILALMVGGAVYAVEKLDVTSFLDQMSVDESPLLIDAVVAGDLKKVKALLEDGVDPDIQDVDGWSALHWAVKDTNLEIAQAILDSGANPNLADFYDEVPLMSAAGDGNTEMVKLLLHAGANIEQQDYYAGWTPLMYAVTSGNTETVVALLEAGADAAHRDFSNITALMLAIKNGEKEIAELLRGQ